MEVELLIQVLAVIGILSLVSGILYLFTTIGKNVSPMSISEKTPSIRSREFLLNLATVTGGGLQNFDVENCEIFTDNDKYFKQLLEDIKKAQDSISIMTFVWEEDEVSKKFFDALIEAAKRGVEVRLSTDAFGSNLSESFIEELRKNKIEVSEFRPFRLGKLNLYHSRLHRRAYLFDGKVGYFGGSAISKMWFTNSDKGYDIYYDVMYRVEGKAVFPIASTFGELWSASEGQVAQDLYIETLSDSDEALPKNSFYLSHAPRFDVHPLTYALWYSIMCAKESIVIISPYFIPGDTLADVIYRKMKSGVKVKLITQGAAESFFVQSASRSYYQDLLEAGVEVYEYKKAYLHTKMIVIDEHFTIVGSSNFDIRSQRINHEFIYGVQSENFAKRNLEIATSLEPDSEKLVYETWKRRPFWRRKVEEIFKFLSEQL